MWKTRKLSHCKTVLKICSDQGQKSFIPQANYMKLNLRIAKLVAEETVELISTENNLSNRRELMFLCKKIGFKLLFLLHYMDFSSLSRFQLLYLRIVREIHGVNTKRRGQLFLVVKKQKFCMKCTDKCFIMYMPKKERIFSIKNILSQIFSTFWKIHQRKSINLKNYFKGVISFKKIVFSSFS